MTETWHHGLVARWWAEVAEPEKRELAYFRAAITRHGEPALDLGCGTGRLLLPLLADGLDVDGVDISADMIDRLRENAESAGIDVGGRLAVQAFDELRRPRAYAVVFSVGSFAIGGDRQRDATALRRAYEHLRPDGVLLLSYEVLADDDHRSMSDQTSYPRPWPETGDVVTLADGDDLELLKRATGYDAASRTHSLEIRALLWRGGTLVREESGSLRNTYYEPDDLARMARNAGFDQVVVEGPYTGRAPAPGDDTVILVAHRGDDKRCG